MLNELRVIRSPVHEKSGKLWVHARIMHGDSIVLSASSCATPEELDATPGGWSSREHKLFTTLITEIGRKVGHLVRDADLRSVSEFEK